MSGSFVRLAGVGVDVRTWHPTADASGPPTQVHLMIPVDDGPSPETWIAVRLKTAVGVRKLVNAILDHAADVWPEEFPPDRGGSK